MKMYISSSCSSVKALDDVLSELMGFGFKRVELTGNVKHAKCLDEEVLKFTKEYGLDLLIHNYIPFHPDEFVLNLATRDPVLKKQALRHIKCAISLLRRMGKNLFSLHPGFKTDLLPQLKDSFFIRTGENDNIKSDFYSFVEQIVEYINDDNFRLAIENLHPKSAENLYSFLCTPEDIWYFLDYFKDVPNVGLLLDLGHMNVASRRLDFDKHAVLDRLLSDYSHKIFEFHISENDGSHDTHNVTLEDSWQLEYLETHRRHLKDIPVIMEWHDRVDQDSFKRFEVIRERLEG